jgi:hypothetical protein
MSQQTGKRILFFSLIIQVFVFLVFSQTVFAAPYAPDSTGKNTIYDRLYESDLVMYVSIVRKSGSRDGGNMTEVKVLDNIKGGTWKKGDYFYINSIIKAPNNTNGVLYIFKSEKEGKEFFELNTFYADLEGDIYRYTIKIKGFIDKNDTEGRLKFLFSMVDYRNELIAWDAFCQLGAASYTNLKFAAPSINPNNLRYLIGFTDMKANRKSFFIFLLGLAGHPEDSVLIRKIIDDPKYQETQAVYGAAMAYGLLKEDHPQFFLLKIQEGPKDNIRIAILEAIKNLFRYEKAQNQELLSPIFWALSNGSKATALKAIEVSSELKLKSPVRFMKYLYFDKFKDDPKGRIAVINYLKFVRKRSPVALYLIELIKKQEKDKKVRERI